MYIESWTKAREYIRIKKYTHKSYGAPNRKRTKRLRDTPKAMIKYNNQQRAEKLQMLMILNFNKGFHVILDYPKDNRPKTYEEAETNLKKCLYKVSRRLKRKDKQFKYIAITERGKRAAALHHHIIIEGYSEIVEELMRAWGQHIKISAMYEEGAYKDLADYICKMETKEELTKGKSKYHRSRNLKEPVKRTRVRPGTFKDEPQIPKGYELVEHTLVNGHNDIVGVRYQHYMCKKENCIEKRLQKQCKKSAKAKSKLKKDKKCTVWESIKRLFKKRS